MTKKQERILHVALRLFAEQGFASTSTSRVAKEAAVSEGLIFRHFNNKEGLLAAIMQQAHESATTLMNEITQTSDPKSVLQKALEIPFGIEENQFEMWRLIYALKWQTNQYDTGVKEPMKQALLSAFEKLGYEDPEAEVELILMYIDGAATSFLLHPPNNKPAILKSLKKKYDLK